MTNDEQSCDGFRHRAYRLRKSGGRELPDGVTAIEAMIFGGCRSLRRLTLPAGITSIHGSAFGGCPALTLHVTRGSFAEDWCRRSRRTYDCPGE